MSQKLVINKELVKVKGHYKVIIIKKDDFYNVLKLVKLRILNKEYEALMPPLNGMKKNTIDVNGLSVLISQYMSAIISGSGSTSSTTPAQMVLTTQSGTVNLQYTGSVNINSQGVSVYLQIFEEGGNYTFQYYYVGYDTTSNSYTTSEIELYASAFMNNTCSTCTTNYTDIIRIAYASVSFTKTSDSYLFIVWLIQFQNIPPYAVIFIPTFQNNSGIMASSIRVNSSYTVYFNNGNCTFTCSGNCPSAGLSGFIVYVQGNCIIIEFPIMGAIGTGVSSLEILICSNVAYGASGNVFFTISNTFTTTLTPPVSGGTFYLALATITLTFQTS